MGGLRVLACNAQETSHRDFMQESVIRLLSRGLERSRVIGTPLAILRRPEAYELRVRELILRTWGIIDDAHPYIKELVSVKEPRSVQCITHSAYTSPVSS